MKTANSKNWWWNKFLKLERGSPRRAWFEENEAAAFYYELARRNFPLNKFPAFTELKRGEHTIAFIRFSQKFARWKPPVVVNHIGDKMILHDGYVVFPTLSWNLQASKNALLEAFWKEITAERSQRGIAEPEQSKSDKGGKSRNANNTARTVGEKQPWRWLEVMDEPHGLNNSDRSKKSQAKKRMAEIKSDFLLLWGEIEKHRAFSERYYKEHPQALQIDREPVKW